MAAFSDNFSGALDSRWVLRNPLGDVTFNTNGGQLNIDSPIGLHDYWKDSNDAGKCVQPVSDVDFEVVAKFNSLPVNNGDGLGITIEQGIPAVDTLRTGFYSTGGGSITAFFSKPVPVFVNEVITSSVTGSVIWQKVTKVGSTFTFSWSDDGVLYTTPSGGVQVVSGFVTNHIGMYTTNPAATAFNGLTEYIEFASDPFPPPGGNDDDLFNALVGINP